MTEYDSPWKEAIDLLFEDFMHLCFPAIHEQIDWSVVPKMLDKELQQIAPESEVGLRVVDKLVEVKLHSGLVEWLLIHIEVQNQRTTDFVKRIFTCFCRIRDKYDKPLVCLAVLGDESPTWRPNQFSLDTMGCKVDFVFPIVKLVDFRSQLELLEISENPFASIIVAHLQSIATRGLPPDRLRWKVRIVRGLYERGWTADRVRQVFRVIDWIIDLPAEQQKEFGMNLNAIEKEKSMPYVTSIERLAREEGIEQGIEKGIEQGLEQGVILGQIQLLAQLLGVDVPSLSDLQGRPLPELETLLDDLNRRFKSRN